MEVHVRTVLSISGFRVYRGAAFPRKYSWVGSLEEHLWHCIINKDLLLIEPAVAIRLKCILCYSGCMSETRRWDSTYRGHAISMSVGGACRHTSRGKESAKVESVPVALRSLEKHSWELHRRISSLGWLSLSNVVAHSFPCVAKDSSACNSCIHPRGSILRSNANLISCWIHADRGIRTEKDSILGNHSTWTFAERAKAVDKERLDSFVHSSCCLLHHHWPSSFQIWYALDYQ